MGTVEVVGGDLLVTPALGEEGVVAIVLEVFDEAGLAETMRFEVQVEFYWPASVVGGWRGSILIEAARAASPAARQ